MFMFSLAKYERSRNHYSLLFEIFLVVIWLIGNFRITESYYLRFTLVILSEYKEYSDLVVLSSIQ